MSKQDDYEHVEKRIAETPSLQPFEHILLYDWGDDTFWRWVAMAELEEVIAWAEDVSNLPED
jgi:hypothetical protein